MRYLAMISRARTSRLSAAVLASALLLGCSKQGAEPLAPTGSAAADLTAGSGCPANLPKKVPGTTWDCGCYDADVNPKGGPNNGHESLAHNKQAFWNAGADHRFLTSAMIETDFMDARYDWGDNKTGLSFNAGATKQNWGMIQEGGYWKTTGAYGYGKENEAGPGHDMAHDRALDVRVYNANVLAHGGIDHYLAGHRNGATGLANPNTSDIRMFVTSWHWIDDQLHANPDYYRNGIRFWVNIPPI